MAEWDDERIPAAVMALHKAAQNLADAMGDHLTVSIEAPSLTARLKRIYHPPDCSKHREWETDPNNEQKTLPPAQSTSIPDGFKGLFK